MAITTSRVHHWSDGARFERIIDVTFDSSYPTGGYPLTVANTFLRNAIYDVRDGVSSGGHVVRYNPTTGKLQLYVGGAAASTPLAELANATNVSTVTARLRVTGK